LLRRFAPRNDVESPFETKKPAVIRDGRLLSMREKNSATVTLRNAYRNDGIGKTAREAA
jgi:hypothetical protein